MDGSIVLGFVVRGDVAQQGSKNGFAIYRGSAAKGTREFTGRVAVVESGKKKLDPWREAIKEAARASVGMDAPASDFPLDGPVMVRVAFSLPSPRRVPGSRFGWPSVVPDIDKYTRAALDALTMAGVWTDDGRAVSVDASKHYDLLPEPGAVFEVYRLLPGSAEAAKDRIRSGIVYRRFTEIRA